MRPCLALAVLAAPLFAGCATTHGTLPPVAAALPAVPADDNLNAVLWAQRAAEHDLVLRELYGAAQAKLVQALADPSWDALPTGERAGPFASLPPAVIVDVDETVLDNSPYQARLVRSGREYDDTTWAAWCREERARPVEGALEFARFAAEHGVTVFYLTNRARELAGPTLSNLRKDGFPAETDDVFLGLGTEVAGCAAAGSGKGCRRQLVGRGHRVLLQVGDQLGDFVDVSANTLDGRAKDLAPYASWIGERWLVLPNPTYGSWEAASFGNAFKSPRDARRRAKIDALRVE